MQFSHSRVSTFNQCPYKFKLSYVDELKAINDPMADDALICGNALHLGIETDIETMIHQYYSKFNLITDKHINEVIKLEILQKKVKDLLNSINVYKQEFEINDSNFKGIVDLITMNDDGSLDVFDFKYSNHIDRYMDSEQLHIYKYYLEKLGFKVRKLGFIFIPKTGIRQKKTEDLYQFRKRLISTLDDLKLTIIEIEYDYEKVVGFHNRTKNITKLLNFLNQCDDIKQILPIENKTIDVSKNYLKNETRLCDWCEFNEYCMKGYDYMLLPKNEKRDINLNAGVKVWVYAPPFAGKSYFANQFPDALFLNTDGNVKFLNSPHLPIKDTIEIEGRIKNPIWGWETFKTAVDEVIEGQHEFKTIIVDLLDDIYESARLKKLSDMGIDHETDAGYGKGHDQVRTEFLPIMRKLTNTQYNIIFISHEITSEINKKNGEKITTRNTPLPIKVANKLAGMVDIVARIEVNDDESRCLKFKSSPTEFGGGRLTFTSKEIPCTYVDFMTEYQTAANKMNSKNEPEQPKVSEEPKNEETATNEEPKKRRTRKKKE